MGKPKKTRGCKFNYNKDRRRTWKKSKRLPAIPCASIRQAWDSTKSTPQNLRNMGLSADPNKTIPIINSQKVINSDLRASSCKNSSNVVKELEDEASQTYANTMRLSNPNVQFCVYMMNKYKEDYKAMAKDPKNHYQETPKQIRRKINTFKNTPTQYKQYLASQDCSSPMQLPDENLVCPRRVRTRLSEAAFRNGHLTTHSPLRPLSSVKDSTTANKVHVRRRLQFGRKPPKDRCTYGIIQGKSREDIKLSDADLHTRLICPESSRLGSPLHVKIKVQSQHEVDKTLNDGNTKKKISSRKLRLPESGLTTLQSDHPLRST